MGDKAYEMRQNHRNASTPVSTSATPSVGILSARKPSFASSVSSVASVSSSAVVGNDEDNSSINSNDGNFDQLSPAPSTARKASTFKNIPPLSQVVNDIFLLGTVAPSQVSLMYGTCSNTLTGHPTLTLRTQTFSTRSFGPSATATSLNPAVLCGSGSGLGNLAPGGIKAECSNTPSSTSDPD